MYNIIISCNGKDKTDNKEAVAAYYEFGPRSTQDTWKACEENIKGSDATLIFDLENTFHYVRIVQACKRHDKPYYIVRSVGDAQSATAWLDALRKNNVDINVLGPAITEFPGAYREAKRILDRIFRDLHVI